MALQVQLFSLTPLNVGRLVDFSFTVHLGSVSSINSGAASVVFADLLSENSKMSHLVSPSVRTLSKLSNDRLRSSFFLLSLCGTSVAS